MKQTLPGKCEAYVLPDGAGERYLIGGQLATAIARPEDTDGRLEAVIVAGREDSRFPRHVHRTGHEAIIVLDGRVELTLDSRRYLLTRGDYASIPPGTPHSYCMRGHYSRLLAWTVNGAATRLLNALGQSASAEAYGPGGPAAIWADQRRRAEAFADVAFLDDDEQPAGTAHRPSATVAPDEASPYVLGEGEGERMVAGDQLFTFLSHQGNTGGAFIALTTLGPKGGAIPKHFHEKHAESFFCLDGRMTMWSGDEEVTLHPGDFLHAPPGAIHSYRLDAPVTKFVGLLAPGLFEPFFRALCDPCEAYLFPVTPGPVRFDRVMQKLHELDLKLVGPPRPPGHE